MIPDFITLKAFVSVVEEGSIAGGAAREHLVPSAISRRISVLEEEVGTMLLYRVQKGISVTPAGSALFHHAKQMLLNLQRIESDLSEYAKGIKGHVRVFANTSTIVQFLPEDLNAFLTEHPKIKIDLEERTSANIVLSVESRMTDIGICSSNVSSGNLQTFPYREDRLMIVTRLKHPLAKRKSAKLSDTVDYDHVGLQEGSSLYELIMTSARTAGLSIRLRIQVSSFDGLRRMVRAGLGIGILPQGSLDNLKAMGLCAIPLDEEWARRRFIICVRDLAALPVTAQLLVKSLVAR